MLYECEVYDGLGWDLVMVEAASTYQVRETLLDEGWEIQAIRQVSPEQTTDGNISG